MSVYRTIGPLVSKLTFSEKSFRITIGVSNSFDPDQARQFIGPDLSANCLENLSADDSGSQGVSMNSHVNLHSTTLAVTVHINMVIEVFMWI